MQLTGIIKKAGNYYVALCPELNVSSQGVRKSRLCRVRQLGFTDEEIDALLQR